MALDGRAHDPERLRYLQEHVASCARAIQLGVPLAGYFAWSLLDNLEWADGYRPRFGLVYVDFATQRRVLKDSGAAYADIQDPARSFVRRPGRIPRVVIADGAHLRP